MDNLGIVLGRNDRTLLNRVVQVNRALKRLHHFHHALHACAKVPKLKVLCQPMDIFLERAIRGLYQLSQTLFRFLWQRGVIASKAEALRLKTRVCSLSRAAQVPLQKIECSICRLPQAFKILEESLPSAGRSCRFTQEIGFKLQWVNKKSNWNYRLCL